MFLFAALVDTFHAALEKRELPFDRFVKYIIAPEPARPLIDAPAGGFDRLGVDRRQVTSFHRRRACRP
jgi:hypothetical protein